jgi:hypothetical protein
MWSQRVQSEALIKTNGEVSDAFSGDPGVGNEARYSRRPKIGAGRTVRF